MKESTLFLSLLLASVLAVPQTLNARVQEREMKFRNLQSQFSDPSKDYRPAPLWVWNTEVTTADIDRMLQELKDQGFGGAFVHPRPGLVTEYLSDEWFRLWRYSLEKGKELGLDIWIYDENSYPSGFAGGHVPSQMPESYDQGQGLAETKTDKAPSPEECFLCLIKDGDSFKDITECLSEYSQTPGEYYVFTKTYTPAAAWNAGYPYVDLMVDGVTEKFIEATFSGYEKEFGEEFGTTIKGTFTDEPNIACPGGCRWTPDLFDTFQKRWGYDLRTVLPLLFEQIGDFRKVRHDYNSTLLQLFIDRWCKPFYEYTEGHNLYWTGHYWEHDWPNLFQGPDNMAMYAWHQMPAIDMLFNQYNDEAPTAQFGNVRSVKEVRSVANQKGYVRTVSETYGGGGWDVSFADFKRLGDWEYALGVNFMNQHLCHMTITGVRKYDYPPVFTSISPWWEEYGRLNDYFGRLSVTLSQGEQINDILILEPTTSLWLYYTAYEMPQVVNEIGTAFQTFVTALEKGQLEYDLGSENIIKDCGSVSDGKLSVGMRAYGTVVLPPMMESIDSAIFDLIRTFVAQGGKLIAFSKPQMVDGARSQELVDLLSGRGVVTMASPAELLAYSARKSDFKVSRIRSTDLYHQRRMYDDGQLIFFVNSSLEKEATAKVTASGKYLYRLDPQTGKTYLEKASRKARKTWKIKLSPAESAMYFISGEAVLEADAMPAKLGRRKEVSPLSPLTAEPLKPNALTLDFCDLSVGDSTRTGLYTIDACRALYGFFGMNDPWESAVQFRNDIMDNVHFSPCPVKVDYHFTIGKDVCCEGMKAIVERPDIWSVAINGMEVESEGASIMDARTGLFSIGEYVHEGENILSISLNRMHVLAEIAPVIIQGGFSVADAPKGFTIEAAGSLGLGSWRAQGFPFYSWDVAYSQKWDISDTSAPYTLELASWKGTVAVVYVNGEKAGIISRPPYELQVETLLCKGENIIEVRVAGSIRNVYGPHYNTQMGITGPWMWNGVTEQAAGSDYIFFDYGLMGEGMKLFRR